ncbi:hypothetical protein PLESTF_001200600 [Pleodorina starrii]|nr:hypothetical protein PLESTF_001200600 [Pleodorina starrii]
MLPPAVLPPAPPLLPPAPPLLWRLASAAWTSSSRGMSKSRCDRYTRGSSSAPDRGAQSWRRM